MVLWRDYLAMLREDGVYLAAPEEEALTDDGHRIINYTLTRYVGGQMLGYPIGTFSEDDPVPRGLQRRIANTLNLPPEKYILREPD